MKKNILMAALALSLGVASFMAVKNRGQAPSSEDLVDALPELQWLRKELGLADKAFARVRELHEAYRPKCREMCASITRSRAKILHLSMDSRSMNDELNAGIHEYARTIAECKQSMLDHLYQTAALMDEPQADRFLEITIPLALETAAFNAHDCH